MVPAGDLPNALDRNIEQIAKLRDRLREHRKPSARFAEAVGEFIGSFPSIFIHLAFFAGWVAYNSLSTHPFDRPPFNLLNVFACVEAIFLTMFVLIRQKRTLRAEERRSELDLQMSLLTEHEVTRLIRLTDLIATKLGVSSGKEIAEAREVQADIDPMDVIERMEESFEAEP